MKCVQYQLVQVEIDTELCLFKIFVSLLTVSCFYARIPQHTLLLSQYM